MSWSFSVKDEKPKQEKGPSSMFIAIKNKKQVPFKVFLEIKTEKFELPSGVVMAAVGASKSFKSSL